MIDNKKAIPQITVLMLVAGEEPFLCRAIDSILRQTFSNFELLIIAEFATPNSTLDTISAYKDERIRVTLNKSKLGISKSLNLGLDMAKGEYVARMDADDIAYITRLEKQVKFMEDNPQIGMCGTYGQLFGDEHWVFEPALDHETIKIELMFGCAFLHPTVMLRLSAINKYNLRYDPMLEATEDYDFWHRMIDYIKVANIDEILLDYRKHNNSATNKNEGIGRKIYKSIMKDQLVKVGVNPSEDEIDFHYKLFTNWYSDKKMPIKRIKKWFQKIKEANLKQYYCDQGILEKILKQRYDNFVISCRCRSIKKMLKPVYSIFMGMSKMVVNKLRIFKLKLTNLIRCFVSGQVFKVIHIGKKTYYLRLPMLGKIKEAIHGKGMKYFYWVVKEKIYRCQEGSGFKKDVLLQDANKRILFFVGCPEGESVRYRVHNLVNMLSKHGYYADYFFENEIYKLHSFGTYDLLIIFRARFNNNIKLIIKKFKNAGIPIVFDVDDLVFEPDAVDFIGAVRHLDEIDEAEKQFHIRDVELFKKTILLCDYATCATDFLTQRIKKNGINSFVVKNSINEAQYQLAQKLNRKKSFEGHKNILKIGYFSGSNTHNIDFLAAADAVYKILEKYHNVEFHVIGDLILDSKFSQFDKRIIRKRFMPYLSMLKYLSMMDINIAPLELNNPFTDSKSELKIFEAALVKVPSVVSGVDSYRKIVKQGANGFIANTSSEWERYLSLLLEDNALRAKIAEQAYHDFTKMFCIDAVAKDAIKVYENIIADYKGKIEKSDRLDMAWIIPEPFEGSGGHKNIFRAINMLSNFGHRITMYFTGGLSVAKTAKLVNSKFYNFAHLRFAKYEGNESIKSHDICFATHWTTVYPMVADASKFKKMYYFVQDFEPYFSPIGTEYILAENTYKMGLTCITSGHWLVKLLKEKYNTTVDCFLFPIDKSVYHVGELTKRSMTGKKRIIFFSRPEMPRRCFTLGLQALSIVKQKLPTVEIVLYGSSKIDSNKIGFEHINLGLLDGINGLAELYRSADLGIVFSTTNPSLVPFEMMACGLAVADLKFDDYIAKYGAEENAFFINTLPDEMANDIINIINQDKIREQIALNGLKYVRDNFIDEESMGKRIESLIFKFYEMNHQQTAN